LLIKSKATIFFGVHAICSLFHGDEFLINYNFHRPTTTCQNRLGLGLPLDIPLGHKKKDG